MRRAEQHGGHDQGDHGAGMFLHDAEQDPAEQEFLGDRDARHHAGGADEPAEGAPGHLPQATEHRDQQHGQPERAEPAPARGGGGL
ncbi:hypothetical protein [Nonomuraea sp. NPDC003201]